MRHAHEDPELQALVRRYVTPDRRYLRLGGHLLKLTGAERALFSHELAGAAAEITPRELTVLLEGGWRERKTAAWLIAVAGRTAFRNRLGELLLASEGPYAGAAYCVALANFGTTADAELLSAYLDRYLRRPDLYYDQAFALGALLYLDAQLGADHSGRFLTPGGLWQQWTEGPPSKSYEPQAYLPIVGRLCAFAQESADLL
ncbi:DUF6000 family protein [Kitasatospora sp. NPDC094019]|uniref:DUF6000 family protein n=1 Tax=Kitasatospora sp. NPDC094019 TaxID=3364091 RepID=UPI003821587F